VSGGRRVLALARQQILEAVAQPLYISPRAPRTSNAFTSAFKALDPIPQFKATAKLGEFLEARFSQSF
jgi:hypothetical protein